MKGSLRLSVLDAQIRPGLLAGGDTTAPSCTLTTDADPIIAAAFSVTATFSEDVTGFVVGDITVGNGSAGSFVASSASVYTFTVTPTAAGDVTVQVGAGVCTDGAGNPNTASNTLTHAYIALILNDSFDTAYGAGLIPSPLTADPGPGSSSVRDTAGVMSISSGALNWTNTAGAWTARVYHDATGIARSAGLAYLLTLNAAAADSGFFFGWMGAANRYNTPTLYADAFVAIVADGSLFTLQLAGSGAESGSSFQIARLALGTNTLVMTARATGCLFWHNNAGTWDLLWVSHVGSDATIYRMASHNGWDGTTQLARVANLGASVAFTDADIAYFYDATPTTLDTATGNASGMIDITWTPSAGDTLELQFRRASGASYAAVRCNESTVAVVGNTIELIHDGAQQDAAAFTFNSGTTYRVLVKISGSTVDVSVNTVLRTPSATFASSHNSTETGIAISAAGTIVNWGMWPLAASGDIATALTILATE